ncbi:MAG: radical SAM protein [Lachnospiraceae bacterium]|nr:radical SAM protein [Lachnospiraceae bacterium]
MITESRKKELLAHAEETFAKVEELQRLGLVCDDGDFVPSVHYPPITQYDNCDIDEYFKTYTLPADGMMDIYVHIPFCIQHCTFCHYPGLTGERVEEKKKYIDYLIREMDIYREYHGIDKIKPRSILLGGGTPTSLTPELLEHFLTEFEKRVDLSACKQYNVDLGPNSINGESGTKKCEIMKAHGITRLTIGLQSLNDDVLKLMNRPHNSEEAIQSVYKALEYGFDVNIEFIYGHPGETIDNWIEDMEKAVGLPMNEIQVYRLKVQAYGDFQGIINRFHRGSGSADIPDFKSTMMMKQIAQDIFNEHGFNERLRRVFTKNKAIFSHYAYNQCCNQFDQVGFGLTGFSSYRDRFDINTQNFEEYYAAIDAGKLPINRGLVRSAEEQARWAIVLPLKNRDVRKTEFKQRSGYEFDDVFKTKVSLLKEYGLLEDTGNIIRLTELGGFVADEVCEQFNSIPYLPFPRERYAEGPLNPYLNNVLFE